MQGFICRSAGWGACFVKAKRGGGNFRVSGSEFLRKVAQKWTVIFGNVALRDLQGAGQRVSHLQTWFQQLAPSHYIKSCMQTVRDRTRLGN